MYGETGTGKEVLADVLHNHSSRRDRPCVKVNCAALPSEIVDAELFGAMRGAYTGSHVNRDGLVMSAEGGTLVLDEMADLSSATQAKLLRVLQDRNVRRVGSTTLQPVDFRLVCLVNRQPSELMTNGSLRTDLFYRINVVTVNVPPLRERREEIVPLFENFFRYYAARYEREPCTLSFGARQEAEDHPWPGNVRQLQNEAHRLSVTSTASLVSRGRLFEDDPEQRAFLDVGNVYVPTESGFNVLDVHERQLIIGALRRTGGRLLEAANELRLDEDTLVARMARLRLDPVAFIRSKE